MQKSSLAFKVADFGTEISYIDGSAIVQLLQSLERVQNETKDIKGILGDAKKLNMYARNPQRLVCQRKMGQSEIRHLII